MSGKKLYVYYVVAVISKVFDNPDGSQITKVDQVADRYAARIDEEAKEKFGEVFKRSKDYKTGWRIVGVRIIPVCPNEILQFLDEAYSHPIRGVINSGRNILPS
ncbi:hypothetical protein KC723_00595 [Candidatus Kaiserbacteria bacterium]|nr:hypothetical protein [Candidatus Kaiserbacteria bacterium]